MENLEARSQPELVLQFSYSFFGSSSLSAASLRFMQLVDLQSQNLFLDQPSIHALIQLNTHTKGQKADQTVSGLLNDPSWRELVRASIGLEEIQV